MFQLLEYWQGGANALTVGYAPERRELGILVDQPKKSVVPAESGFRHMPSRKEVVADLRKDAGKARIYRDLTARFALCILDYAFAVTPPSLVDTIALYGHVHAKAPGTGRSIHPCFSTSRSLESSSKNWTLMKWSSTRASGCAL